MTTKLSSVFELDDEMVPSNGKRLIEDFRTDEVSLDRKIFHVKKQLNGFCSKRGIVFGLMYAGLIVFGVSTSDGDTVLDAVFGVKKACFEYNELQKELKDLEEAKKHLVLTRKKSLKEMGITDG